MWTLHHSSIACTQYVKTKGDHNIEHTQWFMMFVSQEIVAEEIEVCFNQINEVIKHGGESYVVVDKNRET